MEGKNEFESLFCFGARHEHYRQEEEEVVHDDICSAV
jgi:hypothetical protein